MGILYNTEEAHNHIITTTYGQYKNYNERFLLRKPKRLKFVVIIV